MTPDYWEQGKTYLRKRDKTLKKIIDAYEGEALSLRGDAFFTLARSIAGQQISVKAADSIWNRLLMACDPFDPETVAHTDAAILRACGFSNSKVLYLHSLANHFLENKKTIKNWHKMSDEEIIKELTSIKGIGRWTAEMFLIFGLGRPDVFPVDDLSLLKGIYRHYNNSEKMTLSEVRKVGERWAPYRSLGTWYMWRVLDPVPVAY